MSDQTVRRFHRPSWRDPRLGVGMVLVAASVALCSWILAKGEQTVDVLISTGPLAPGHILGEDDVRVSEIIPGEIEESYIGALDQIAPGSVLTRPVGGGELVPRSAVGLPEHLEVRPILVPLPPGDTRGLAPGRTVELWLTDPGRAGHDTVRAEPRRVASDVVVAGVSEADRLFAGGSTASIEVLVPESEVANVLDAITGPGEVVIVPQFVSEG